MSLSDLDVDKHLSLRFDEILARHKKAVLKAEEIRSGFEALGKGNAKILMVEDDVSAIEVVELTIGGLGYDFMSLYSGKTQTGFTNTNKVNLELGHLILGIDNPFVNADLIICDVQMPGYNGKDLIKQITDLNATSLTANRKFKPGMQVIFHTALIEGDIENIFGQSLEMSENGVSTIAGYPVLYKNGAQNLLEDLVNASLEKVLAIRGG